ncbi:MAG: hypothetical protein R3F40_09610 [Candidatus Competibacteraceae bacterium]
MDQTAVGSTDTASSWAGRSDLITCFQVLDVHVGRDLSGSHDAPRLGSALAFFLVDGEYGTDHLHFLFHYTGRQPALRCTTDADGNHPEH